MTRADNLRQSDIVAARYRIEGLIGEGGMGRVYRATQLNLGRQVALKVLTPELLDDSGIERFMREAKVAAALRHPCAVEIHDMGHTGDLVYIAMELLSGTVLRGLMTEGVAYELPSAVEIAWQLADLLVAAHAISLVHRDLKPENVFIEDPLRVRVVDFGLAFIEGGLELGRLTREGIVVGTPAYIAPEQAQALHVGTPADIYSFGCVLYELVTGFPPFRGSQVNVLTQHLYVTPVRPRERAPEASISAELDELISVMMAKRPEDRPTATQVRDELDLVRRTLSGERHRGRDRLPLQGRAARMVSVVPNRASTLTDVETPLVVEMQDAGIRLAVCGALTNEETLSLASSGIEPIALGDTDDPRAVLADAVLALGQTPERLRALTGSNVPVVATSVDDVEQLSALLRIGVREVLTLPLKLDDLGRKVRRAVERSQRGRT